jgi:hypothetical protein
MPSPLTRHQRSRALRVALRDAQSIGPFSIPVVVGLLAGFGASFVVDAVLYELVVTPWRQFLDAAVFAVVAAPVWLTVQRPDVRDAHDTIAWLNAWETERWQNELGRRLPALPRATPELLDSLPDTMGLRPLRVELLGARGEMDEAWQRLERLPTDTPWQRFERAALEEWLLWWTDGPRQVSAMRAALADVDDPERNLAGRAMVAAAEARRAAVAGGDVISPLAALRPALGDRPRRYAFSYQTGVLISIALIGIIASLAVTVTAAVIR